MFKLFESSKTPGEYGMLTKSALIGLLPVIGILLKGLGQEVDQEALKQVIEITGDVVTAFFALISGIGMLVGFVRKYLPSK